MSVLPYKTRAYSGFRASPEVEEPPESDSESSSESLSSLCEGDSSTESEPEDLDEPWDYTFQCRDAVWVKTAGGLWYRGQISSSRTTVSRTRSGMGTYYTVRFHINKNHISKKAAPLNGELKPDTEHIRRLVWATKPRLPSMRPEVKSEP